MKKLKSRLLLSLVTIGVSVMIPFLSVQATSVLMPSVKLSSASGCAELTNVVNLYSQDMQTGFDYLTLSYTGLGSVIIEVDTYTYKELTEQQKQDLMTFTLSSIQDSSIISMDKTRLYNYVCQTDTSVSMLVRQLSADSRGDFYTAYSYIKPFSGKLGTVLALLAICLFLGLIFSVLIDIFYISVPTISMVLNSGDTNKKPKIVSKEAFKSYLDSCDASNKKDVVLMYIKKKWLQLFIVVLCILYLVSGEIWNLAGDILDLFRGFMG